MEQDSSTTDMDLLPGNVDRAYTGEAALRRHDLVRLHSDLVRFPSLSGQETDIADFLETWIRRRGLFVRRIGDNVVVEWGAGDDVLLVNSHLDVVPPSADHPFDPFTPTIVDGAVYGRGTVDAKASVACMADALCTLSAGGWTPADGRIVAAFTVCEETGLTDNGLETILPELPTPTAALIGEPTEMQPCIAQKGLLILRLIAEGTSAHAARPEEGENAIMKAARDLIKLNTLDFERNHPFLGQTTLSVTTIEGGEANNMIPDRCEACLDLRTTPDYTHPELVERIRSVTRSRVEIHSDRFIPVDTPPEARIVRACLQSDENARPFGSPTMSDWIHVAGTPTVKIGPGASRLSHTSREHIPIDRLAEASGIYQRIIRNYFDQPEFD